MRQDAQRNVPTQRLTPQGRALAQKVMDDVTVFRRLPTQSFECDAEMYRFLLSNPDMVVNMWEVMDVTKVAVSRTGQSSFKLNDGNGTVVDAYYLYRTPQQVVLYCDGVYSGSFFPRPLKGRCLMSVRSVEYRNQEGRAVVQCKLDTFLQIDNIGIELFARTFHNTIGGIADHNFREITGFVSSVSQAAETSPENLEDIASKCRRVPQPVTLQFVDITRRIHSDAIGAAAAAPAPQQPRATVHRPFQSSTR